MTSHNISTCKKQANPILLLLLFFVDEMVNPAQLHTVCPASASAKEKILLAADLYKIIASKHSMAKMVTTTILDHVKVDKLNRIQILWPQVDAGNDCLVGKYARDWNVTLQDVKNLLEALITARSKDNFVRHVVFSLTDNCPLVYSLIESDLIS